MPLLYLARILGTSVKQLDDTYAHLLSDSDMYLRGILDAHDDVRGLNVDPESGGESKPAANRKSADERT